ncbi:MAG: PD-(D/E)XK nuclease family protein [Treponema sp.]|nr:PD-(D/E)XK nuclease family protein [Treponema sp.]
MEEIKLNPDQIAKVLIENIKNPSTVFVFSTDTVMNSWIEYLITHPEISGTDALPLEGFIAWDNFKGKYLHAQEEGKASVPSILRKFFVLDLIEKNASLPKEDRFQVIINPDDEFAKSAASFADWISKNLPSLHFWKKRLDQNAEAYGPLDEEDKDYERLYQLYKDFLDQNGLFEPAWLEKLELGDKDTSFILFYPELLEDFGDYLDIFKANSNITICTMPEDIPNPPVYFYPDSRSELRQTLLSIIKLVQEGKADWSQIALSIPDIDTYRPYIDREFSLYGIPYVIKSGLSLTKNNAGRIFKEIKDCHTEAFSFDSVRALLLDECLPWKEEYKQDREKLIRVGKDLRCICSPGDKDIWLSAFGKKISSLEFRLKKLDEDEGVSKAAKKSIQTEIKEYSDLKDFYLKLKSQVEGFFISNTFKDIEKAWHNFKGIFFEKDESFSLEANAILGRCLSELKEIINIEEAYAPCQLQIPDAYSFFLKELDSKKYSPQQKDKSGVSIFSYKLSGPACFKYQFVIDASQKNLDIPYKRLTFLNATKRAKLHLIEDDKALRASEVFIKLYAKNSYQDSPADKDFVTFSAAEETFSGFAIPHFNLQVLKSKNENGREINLTPNLDSQDYIRKERLYVLSPEDAQAPVNLTSGQKEAFENWKATCPEKEGPYKTNKKLLEKLEKVLILNRHGQDIYGKEVKDSKIKITARADLEKFFPCPRQWLLKSVLKLKDDSLDTELMQAYDMGNFNHKILELFISQFKGQSLPYYDEESDSFKIIIKKEGEINSQAQDFNLDLYPYITEAIKSPSDFKDSPLVTQTLEDQKEKIAEKISRFLKFLLRAYDGPQNGRSKKMPGVGKCTLLDCEKTLAISGENFDYFGKIDCLLLSPENDWIILDYKNAGMPSAKDIKCNKNDLLGDFQMPVYFKLLDEEHKHEISAAYFYSINNCENSMVVDKKSLVTAKDENGKAIKDSYVQNALYKDFKLSMDCMQEYAKVFNSISNPESGSLDFMPYTSSSEKDKLNVKSFENCISCAFKGICRTTYNVAGKNIARASANREEN